MSNSFRSSRDVIIRTKNFAEAIRFYETVLGLSATRHSDSLVGFETGEFCLYVEKGEPPHGPVFEYLVDDVVEAKRKLLSAGCALVEEGGSVPHCYMRDPYGVVFNIGPAR
jgi:catechol 2,3-dioxygenase-like lactoylglutathione lyase family enzyme